MSRSSTQLDPAPEHFAVEFERAVRETFDAAIVDIGLPVIDGHEVARGLRKLGQPGLVVLALSG